MHFQTDGWLNFCPAFISNCEPLKNPCNQNKQASPLVCAFSNQQMFRLFAQRSYQVVKVIIVCDSAGFKQATYPELASTHISMCLSVTDKHSQTTGENWYLTLTYSEGTSVNKVTPLSNLLSGFHLLLVIFSYKNVLSLAATVDIIAQ